MGKTSTILPETWYFSSFGKNNFKKNLKVKNGGFLNFRSKIVYYQFFFQLN